MTKFDYQLQMDKDCRRAKDKQQAVLDWVKSKKLYGQDGRKPTVNEFISEALKPGTKLYKANVLEHDKKKAADLYYYNEAQYYLRHVQVIKINIKTKQASPPIRAFIPIKFSAHGKIDELDYATAKRVANDPSLRQTVMENAWRDLIAWRDRYMEYAEFLKEFDPVIKSIAKVHLRKSA